MLNVIGYITLLAILVSVLWDIRLRRIDLRKLKRELEQLKKNGNTHAE